MSEKRKRKRPDKKPQKRERAIVDYTKKPLSPREQSAADYYLKIPSKYKACIAAGYSANTAKVKAWDIFERPHVKYYLTKRARERQAEHDITIDDQIRRIDNIIIAFEEIMFLSSKPKLGKRQQRKMEVLLTVVKGHTILEAIKLQSHYMGFQPKLSKEAALGPRFGMEDSEL